MQDRRSTAKQSQDEYWVGKRGLFDGVGFAKRLLHPQMRAGHPRAVDPRRDLADEVERCVLVEGFGQRAEGVSAGLCDVYSCNPTGSQSILRDSKTFQQD